MCVQCFHTKSEFPSTCLNVLAGKKKKLVLGALHIYIIHQSTRQMKADLMKNSLLGCERTNSKPYSTGLNCVLLIQYLVLSQMQFTELQV